MGSIKFNAKLEKREVYERRLNAVAPKADQYLRDSEMEAGEFLADRVKSRAPRGSTGAYARSIHANRLSDEPAATAKNKFIKTKDKNAVGLFADFIWRFLEFGTSQHSVGKGSVKKKGRHTGGVHPGTAAQPHIFPTYRANRKTIRKIVRKGLTRAVKEAKNA